MSHTDQRPEIAMVLAAGLGKRMLPLTERMPKPLVSVGGRTLIDFALDSLSEAGIQKAVINVHHFADMLEVHICGRRTPHILISNEREELLETGGGIKKALPLLGSRPFITFNADSMWIEGTGSNLERLMASWNPDAMDVLMLLAPLATSIGYNGRGDFAMDPSGRLRRRREAETVPFVYTGIAIMKPEMAAETPAGPFSANVFYDRAIAKDRLHGLLLDGQWLHIGDPQAIAAAEACMAASATA